MRRGLIHEAHGGVLYIDEVNLLADSLTDALLDIASSGRHFVERDGFSVASDSQFILLGISFRGPKAEIVLDPCRDADAAQRALELLPTGGRTPLAHALHLAASLVNSAAVVILVTDGRANVPLDTADPWADALTAAQRLTCACVLVDSSIGASPDAAMESLASSMRAKVIRLDDLSKEAMLSVLPAQSNLPR